jgi:tRNA-dihydrouridine synthase
MKTACQYISALGFDGIDINMGCPDRSVIDQGAGSALIKTPALAREIIRAAHAGTAAAGQYLPISVKTRIGFNKEEIDTWISELLKEDISALTVHLRTKKEMSEVPAHWEYMKKIVKMVKDTGKDILVIGNGDINNLFEAKQKCEETGCDGVMIGRGVFGNPWVFSDRGEVSLKDKIEALKEHIKYFNKLLMQPKSKHYDVMKKHFKAYINGFDGAKEIREKLMCTHSPEESLRILSTFQKTLN